MAGGPLVRVRSPAWLVTLEPAAAEALEYPSIKRMGCAEIPPPSQSNANVRHSCSTESTY
jgi:hypothetical protein